MVSDKFLCLLLSSSFFSVIAAISSLQPQHVRTSSTGSSRGQKLFSHSCRSHNGSKCNQPVLLLIHDNYVVLENGILQVNLSKPQGMVTGIQYNGIDNLLEALNKDFDRGYWDIVWSGKGTTGKKGDLDRLKGARFKVVVQNEDQVEISFTRLWNASLEGKAVPLNIDKRFIMLRGSSGFYTYAIYEHLEGWPNFHLGNTRIAFKLRQDKYVCSNTSI
uniref:Rhamnogalacturonate lyase B n=1 Tax=Rhizophora mucronata TaxID=61149 RepID=A0A2P2IRL7_RHIMU